MSSIFFSIFLPTVCSRLDVSLVTGTSDMVFSATVTCYIYTWFERPIRYYWSYVLLFKCLIFITIKLLTKYPLLIGIQTRGGNYHDERYDTAHKIPAKLIFELKIWADSLSVPLRRRGSTTRMRQIRNLVKLSLKQQLDICRNQAKLSTFVYNYKKWTSSALNCEQEIAQKQICGAREWMKRHLAFHV